MNMKMLKAAIAGLVLSVSSFANAGIIDHGVYTEDTATGLAFLDLNIFSTDSFSNLQLGVSYGGFNWNLATVDQFTTFLANGTNTTIPTWNGSNLGDFNLNNTNLGAFITFFAGSTSSGEFSLDGVSFGQARAYVHTGFDDVHITQSSNTMRGLFVRNVTVPEPSTLAILALGIMGLASRRFKKQ